MLIDDSGDFGERIVLCRIVMGRGDYLAVVIEDGDFRKR